MAYGPAKAFLFRVKADLLEQKGDRAAAMAALQESVELCKRLPEGRARDKLQAAAEKRLAELTVAKN